MICCWVQIFTSRPPSPGSVSKYTSVTRIGGGGPSDRPGRVVVGVASHGPAIVNRYDRGSASRVIS